MNDAGMRLRIVTQLVDELQREPFQPTHRGVAVGPTVTGWLDRLSTYYWPTPDVTYDVTHLVLQPWFEQAGALSHALERRGAWTDAERAEATKTAWKMQWWGRTPQRKPLSGDTVESVFRRSLGLRVVGPVPMNSGWSKVAALATAYLEGERDRAPHVIWDSRVSTSLVFRIERILLAEGENDPARLFPRIGVVTGRGGTRKVGGPRHKDNLRLPWSFAYGSWSSQDAGSELVRELRDVLNTASYPPMATRYSEPSRWTIRGVESVLFMDGY